MKPIPLNFDHGFTDEQMKWHWKSFCRGGGSNGLLTPELVRGFWRAYMEGAQAEATRGDITREDGP